MPREPKQGQHAFVDEPLSMSAASSPPGRDGEPSSGPLTPPRSLGPSDYDGGQPQAPGSRHRVTARWFAALDAEAEAAPAPPPPSPLPALPLALFAGVAALLFDHPAARVAAALALLVPAAVVLARWVAARRAAAVPGAARAAFGKERLGRGVALDGERLAFLSGRRTSNSVLADQASPGTLRLAPGQAGGRAAGIWDHAMDLLLLDAPFGVTLLASPRRDRLIALLSSASGTFYLSAAFDAASRRAFAPLLDRGFTVVGDDAGMEAIGPDGEPLVLAPDELAALLDALLEQSPSCLDRFVLTDARGAAVTLDGRHLCVGDRAVDLNAPLEWKSIVFQEAFGQAIAVYQGTWIRQSSTELTLVSLLPALGPSPGADLDLGTLDRSVLRDLRLMQASPESPPPHEQRVAIDRLFMLPVRSALDHAPRASLKSRPAQA